MEPKKKMKLNFENPTQDELQKPDAVGGMIDNSGNEIQQLRQQMMEREKQRRAMDEQQSNADQSVPPQAMQPQGMSAKMAALQQFLGGQPAQASQQPVSDLSQGLVNGATAGAVNPQSLNSLKQGAQGFLSGATMGAYPSQPDDGSDDKLAKLKALMGK